MAGGKGIVAFPSENEWSLLPVYAPQGLSNADWSRIRAAKASLGVPFKVKPVEAVLGSPGRVLAIGAEPDWVDCDYALVSSTMSPGLAKALNWVLGDFEDNRAMNTLKRLRQILGSGVREIVDGADGESV